ncbi:hypothetical protein CTheo_7601 [Ceratobasidium theobromae]|uniref:Uncharacterized protein n=1 Tax=Ceratobasidium theobromae TaxID=1582974 RepID=A0A5N5QC10_9AGAM|nr:hypothetical protein CTheo_7601 [Ceratobasidium theobromae]
MALAEVRMMVLATRCSPFKNPLTLLSARAATPKRAVKILLPMLSSTTPLIKYTYEAYLALADPYLHPGGKSASNPGTKLNVNLRAGLHVLDRMRARAKRVVRGTKEGSVGELEGVLNHAERALGFGGNTRWIQPPAPTSSPTPTQPKNQAHPQTPQSLSAPQTSTSTSSEPTYLYHLPAHALFPEVSLYTHLGDAYSAA